MRNYLFAFASATALSLAAAVVPPATAQPVAGAQSVQPAPDVRSGTYALDKSHAKIVWGISHFAFSTYYGEFTDFDAKLSLDATNPEASRLSVTVATPSVDTHDDKLDAHLKNSDFFNVERYPTATFTSTSIRRTGANTADVTGNFTLLGQTKPLTLAVTFNKAGENMGKVYTAGFSATGRVKRSDYGMTYGVPGLGDEVELRISGEFNLV